ncbi:glycosyltransferase family 8 protein [Coleophoma cylindrospora]|uniref:Glycosyltransferase family 8 protein n=1 Tax=Coleophoma cylindrospora TaxID=1849047 RepID=A0A3D8RTV1_9HELO|nr:glycosyltransferase family 8 protein [Coleophoma cylindrospora]
MAQSLPPFLQQDLHYRPTPKSAEAGFLSGTTRQISVLNIGMQAGSRRTRVVLAAVVLALFVYLLAPRSHRIYLDYPIPQVQQIEDAVDWSRFAYVQYVTSTAHLCSSLMIFEALHRFGSKAERLMMIPLYMANIQDESSVENKLLKKAVEAYNVKLAPIQIQNKGTDPTWASSYTKLLAFNQTQYDRVLIMDSDATLLQPMDELFLIAPAPVVLPRAYWLKSKILGSELMLIQPSSKEFARVQKGISRAAQGQYDMEIVNKLYGKDAFVLPHRPYTFMTGDFKDAGHPAWKDPEEKWDPEKVLKEAKYVHFSDWPLAKPWVWEGENHIEKSRPKCLKDEVTKEETDCRARDVWNWMYSDFAQRRKDICDLGLEGSPE